MTDARIALLEDGDMRELASKMAEAYTDQVFRIDLKITADSVLDENKQTS